MSFNKTYAIAAGLILVVGLGIWIFRSRNFADIDRNVTEAISILKQGDDRSRDCEVFDKLVTLSSQSKRATLMVAEMYARGMCKPFNLVLSIEIYRKSNISDDELGRALFQAAEWEIPPDGKTGPSKDQLLSLLNKVKELGYKPTQNELNRITPEYAAVFQ